MQILHTLPPDAALSSSKVAPFPSFAFAAPYLTVFGFGSGAAPTDGTLVLVWTTFWMLPSASKFNRSTQIDLKLPIPEMFYYDRTHTTGPCIPPRSHDSYRNQ